MEIEEHFAICYCSLIFSSHDQTRSKAKGRHETIGEASCSLIEDDLNARLLREDEVFYLLCELDAIIELQEEFAATNGKEVYRF